MILHNQRGFEHTYSVCRNGGYMGFFDRFKKKKHQEEELAREKKMQQAMLDIKKKYGKNAILKGMNLEEGAMARQRNDQIGGHKA